jgi:Ca-activated chloride channel family protein
VLAVVLLPLVALGFRRGWVYVVVVGLMLPLPPAEAFEWRDLWQRPDQQGQAALEHDEPAAAATLFEDPEWAATANYRAGQFEDSARLLQGIDTPDAHYNRGNALASAGALEEAVSAYDRALELEPDHADAAFNRELVAELLEQQEQQQQQQSESTESGDQGEQEDQGESGAQQQNEQQGGETSDSGSEPSQIAGGSPQQSESAGDQSEQQDSSGEDVPADEQLAENSELPEPAADGDQSLQAAAAPEDVEDWASEQAAEQWLRRIPQDPGGLLRRKFREQYRQFAVDQDGNRIYSGGEAEPW